MSNLHGDQVSLQSDSQDLLACSNWAYWNWAGQGSMAASSSQSEVTTVELQNVPDHWAIPDVVLFLARHDYFPYNIEADYSSPSNKLKMRPDFYYDYLTLKKNSNSKSTNFKSV